MPFWRDLLFMRKEQRLFAVQFAVENATVLLS